MWIEILQQSQFFNRLAYTRSGWGEEKNTQTNFYAAENVAKKKS